MIEIGKERIRVLMELAEVESIKNKNPQRAQRYVTLARNLGMRYNIRISDRYRNRYCRTCNSFLGITNTMRTRCQRGKITITCKNCGRLKRIHIH